jgi:hypothetical protein
MAISKRTILVLMVAMMVWVIVVVIQVPVPKGCQLQELPVVLFLRLRPQGTMWTLGSGFETDLIIM